MHPTEATRGAQPMSIFDPHGTVGAGDAYVVRIGAGIGTAYEE